MATTGTEKHARIVLSLSKGGTRLTRRLLEVRVSQLTPTGHIPTPWTVDQFLISNKDKILANDAGRKKEKTYFPGILDKTNLDHWDLCMFCHVLLETCKLDPETQMDVYELRKLRNKLSHLSEPSLDEVKYTLNMNKLEVIFGRVLKKIGDCNLDVEIKGILNSSKNGELSLSDTYKEIYKFFQMEGEIREVLSEHTKGQEAILDKLNIIAEQTKTTDGAAIELPETDVVIFVKNCNTEKQKRLSEWLQKLIDENINKQTTLADDMSNESFHKLREAVDQAVKTFFSNGRQITSTETKCVLLRVRCVSLKHLVNLFRDCISGKLNEQIKPIEAAVKEIPEFEDITLEVAIYTDEFWKVIEKTVSAVEGYVSSQTSKRSRVTVERTQSDAGMSYAVKLSIPAISNQHFDTLRESFECGRVTESMNNIQKAARMDLNLTNVLIEAKLLEKASTTVFTENLQDMFVNSHKLVILTCKLNVSDKAVIWQKDSKPVEETDNLMVGNQKDMHWLAISSAKLTDSGCYSCECGNAQTAAYLTVTDSCEKTNDFSCRKHQGTECSWYCSDHDRFCCSACKDSDHSACVGIKQVLSERPYGKQKQSLTIQRKIGKFNVKIRNCALKKDANDRCNCIITSMCMLPNGNILLTDGGNDRLKKLDSSYNVLSHCDIRYIPYDVSYIGNDKAAVSLRNKGIQFVNVSDTDNMKLEKVVKLDHQCNAMAFRGDTLYVSGRDTIYTYNRDCQQKHVLYKRQDLEKYVYNNGIAVSDDGERIYITCRTTGLITIDKVGNHLFALKSDEMKGCLDVCVAGCGTILILDRSCRVYQVENSGKQVLGKVVNQSDGINGPTSLCYDRKQCRIIVANAKGVTVFDLKYQSSGTYMNKCIEV